MTESEKYNIVEQEKERVLVMMKASVQQLLLRKCMKDWERKNNNGSDN